MLKQFLGKAMLMASLLALAGLSPAAYAAENPSTRVVVPERPGGGGGGGSGGGCYSINERLYGPYTMSFCLGKRGTYKVTGGGLNCNGRLTSRVTGRNLDIKLQRTSCGRGQAWTADSISCSGNGIIGDIVPFVAVPERPGRPGFPGITTITCTYKPSERGYRPMTVRARRTS